jgi:peptidase M28-like protein
MTRRFFRALVALAGFYLLPIALTGQGPDPWAPLRAPRTHTPQPTEAAIVPADLMTRLFLFADDSMGGRALDSRENALGAEYIARELARLGLEPGGDAGSFLQTVPLVYRVLDTSRFVSVNGVPLMPWSEYIPRDQGPGARSIDGAPSVYGGTWGVPASLIPAEAAVGKLVVLSVSPAGYAQGIPGTAARASVAARFPGAAGVAVTGFDLIPRQMLVFYRESGPAPPAVSGDTVPSFLYISQKTVRELLGANPDSVVAGTIGRSFQGTPLFIERPLTYPGRNVVGMLRGSDPALRGEYITIGAHNDHLGLTARPLAHDSMYVLNHLYRVGGADDPPPRPTAAQFDTINTLLAEIRAKTAGRSARPDSVYNGADDDGSGSMGLLEIAEYFAAARVRPKRSLIFIWHVGEEEGLFGSEYFTDHPPVPRDSVVAELNIDMIGRGGAGDVTGLRMDRSRIRGGPDYLQLIGSRRLSTELGNVAEEVNLASGRPLQFDYSMDANGHPQNIYCRSDHWSYARYGIPIVFLSTGGHADYHQVTDEPQYIDYDRLARVTSFVASLASRLGNLDHRVAVDQPVVGPNGECRQ